MYHAIRIQHTFHIIKSFMNNNSDDGNDKRNKKSKASVSPGLMMAAAMSATINSAGINSAINKRSFSTLDEMYESDEVDFVICGILIENLLNWWQVAGL